jgi:hypothetical protein
MNSLNIQLNFLKVIKMATQTIKVFIDEDQLIAQKNNNYSLYLAKKVNGAYTVIWKSKGPKASAGNPSYQYLNTFDITIPSFQINYTTEDIKPGFKFSSQGKSLTINLGQQVALDENGVFGAASQGNEGEITINNELGGNPHAILMDDKGNNIFVNTQSGMDTGQSTLTPKDSYQLWFGNYQETGSVIAKNNSKVVEINFAGETEKVVSYSHTGDWIQGPLDNAKKRLLESENHPEISALNAQLGGGMVQLAVAFTPALSFVVLGVIANKLIEKFSGNLKPHKIFADGKSKKIVITFSNNTAIFKALMGDDTYVTEVDDNLKKLKNEVPELNGESWSIEK